MRKVPYLKAKYCLLLLLLYLAAAKSIYCVQYTQIAPAAVPSTDTVTVTVTGTRHHTRFSLPGAFSFESIFQSLCR